MQRNRGSGGEDEEDDEELATLMRDSARRLSAEARTRQERGQQQQRGRRWRTFLGALVLLGQVFVEIGRRGLAWIERNVPRYIAFVDRCLVNVLRVAVHPRKQVSVLRLLLALGVVCSFLYIAVAIRRIGFPTGRGLTLQYAASARPVELKWEPATYRIAYQLAMITQRRGADRGADPAQHHRGEERWRRHHTAPAASQRRRRQSQARRHVDEV